MKTIKYMETTASSALEEIIVSAKKICTYEMEQQVVVSTSQGAKDNFFYVELKSLENSKR